MGTKICSLFLKCWVNMVRSERAATSIEYALIAVGIAVAIAGAVGLVGGALDVRYNEVEAIL